MSTSKRPSSDCVASVAPFAILLTALFALKVLF